MILNHAIYKTFLISITYCIRLKYISINKFNFENEFNIILDIEIKNNFGINNKIIDKKFKKKII